MLLIGPRWRNGGIELTNDNLDNNLEIKIKEAINEQAAKIKHPDTMNTVIDTKNGTDISNVCDVCMMYEYTKAVLADLLTDSDLEQKIRKAIKEEENGIHHPSDLNNIPDHFETRPLTNESCPMCLMNHYTKNVLEKLL